MSRIAIVLIIIFSAGIFGGLVSFYGLTNASLRKKTKTKTDPPMTDPPADSPPVDDNPWSPMIRGVAAALLVPLFLNSVSSNLIKELTTGETPKSSVMTDTLHKPTPPPPPPVVTPSSDSAGKAAGDSGATPQVEKPSSSSKPPATLSDSTAPTRSSSVPGETDITPYLLLFATCLLAAISSRAFIDSVSKKVLDTANEAKAQSSEARRVAGHALVVADQAETSVKTETTALASALTSDRQIMGPLDTKPSGATISPLTRKIKLAYADIANTDPHKGQFGGMSERDGWKLSGMVHPYRDSQVLCEVTLTVVAGPTITSDEVTFHLHPTFGKDNIRKTQLVDGKAELKVIAWGAFTVGLEANDGKIKLELDLSAPDIDAPDLFKKA